MNESVPLLDRLQGGLSNRFRRYTRSPFDASSRRPLSRSAAHGPIIHCTHHKMGTKWTTSVLSAIASHYGLSLQWIDNDIDRLDLSHDIIVLNHSDLIAQQVEPAIGSHLIRDLRDVVVSGYYYHLWTTEDWAHVPSPHYGGLGFQEYLSSLSEHDGLLAEIERLGRYADERGMMQWDYAHPRFLEMKYENTFGNETEAFSRLFRHYGFTPAAVEQSVQIAAEFSFEKQAAAKAKRQTSHLRSGRPGQWRDLFTAEHRQCFKDVLGELLVRAGYESGHDW